LLALLAGLVGACGQEGPSSESNGSASDGDSAGGGSASHGKFQGVAASYEVAQSELEFYRGEFYHYANNFSLPESGTYTLRAALNPPEFRRHETEDSVGKVSTEPVTVEFENVEIRTGEK
jgi:hypothetical protein